MMNGKLLSKLVLAVCCLALCPAAAANAAETLRIGGGPAPMENIFKRIKPHFERQTGIRLELVENGAIEAYADLNADKIDVASGGMTYFEWRTKVDKNIVEQLEQPQNKLEKRSVGVDYITVYAHPGVGVKELTLAQVKQIFSGQVKNWKQVGGPDLPITVVLGHKAGGLPIEFKKRVLENADFTAGATYVNTAPEIKAVVKRIPGAVAIGTLSQVQDNTINHIIYPATPRQIYMIWKGSSRKQQAIKQLNDYLWSGEAKKYTLSEYPRPDRK